MQINTFQKFRYTQVRIYLINYFTFQSFISNKNDVNIDINNIAKLFFLNHQNVCQSCW